MTIESAGTPPAPPVAAVPTKGFFERLVGVFFSPTETFEDIARKPDILWPLLLIVAIGYITTFVMMPRLDFDAAFAQQAEMMKKKNPNMSDADIERVGRFGRATMTVTRYIGPAVAVAFYAFIALVLWGAVRLMGGEGGYRQSFSATLYAWMPMVLFSIIMTIIIVARGSVDPTEMATVVKSSPAFLVDIKEQPVLASLLGSFDIFTIWMLVLLIIGFAPLSKLSRTKVAAIVLTLWAAVIIVKLGFAAIGAAQMKG